MQLPNKLPMINSKRCPNLHRFRDITDFLLKQRQQVYMPCKIWGTYPWIRLPLLGLRKAKNRLIICVNTFKVT